MSGPHRASSCCHILHLRVRFKFLHENKPETGSDAHTRAVEFKRFLPLKVSDQFSVVQNNTSDLLTLFFLSTTTQEQSNTGYILCECIIIQDVLDTEQKASNSRRAACD